MPAIAPSPTRAEVRQHGRSDAMASASGRHRCGFLFSPRFAAAPCRRTSLSTGRRSADAKLRLIDAELALNKRDVVAHLMESADLRELIESIAANGYVDIEPLVVLEEEKGELTVIEGNRRVAATKLLRSRSARPRRHSDTCYCHAR